MYYYFFTLRFHHHIHVQGNICAAHKHNESFDRKYVRREVSARADEKQVRGHNVAPNLNKRCYSNF